MMKAVENASGINVEHKKKMKNRTFAGWLTAVGLLAGLSGPGRLSAQVPVLEILVGTHALQGSMATPQVIDLYVNNLTAAPVSVGSLDFAVQIGAGAGTQPAIGSVDLIAGTAFTTSNLGQTAYDGNQPQLGFYGVLKGGSGTPQLAPGLNKIASLSVVTAGYASGELPFLLNATGFGDTTYYDLTLSPVSMDTHNGLLIVVPESESILLLSVGLASWAVWRRGRAWCAR